MPLPRSAQSGSHRLRRRHRGVGDRRFSLLHLCVAAPSAGQHDGLWQPLACFSLRSPLAARRLRRAGVRRRTPIMGASIGPAGRVPGSRASNAPSCPRCRQSPRAAHPRAPATHGVVPQDPGLNRSAAVQVDHPQQPAVRYCTPA